MAEGGGGEFGDGDLIDFHHDDDDEQEVNRTQPFQPGAASTPYHVGEQIQMKTFNREQSGLPDTSYVETPLLGDLTDTEVKRYHVGRAIDYIKNRFPRVDFKKLGPIGFGKKPNTQGKIVSYGAKGGETPIFKQDGSGILKSFTDKFEKTLGPRAEQILAEDRNTIREQRQRFEEAEKQLQEAQNIAAEREKESRDIEYLRQQTGKIDERINTLQEEYGSNVESEAELQRLKQLNKNHKTELEKKEKQLAKLEKQLKKTKGVKDEVARESEKLNEMVKKRNQIEERLNSTKPSDELKGREAELQQQNAQDQAIIDAVETKSSIGFNPRSRKEKRPCLCVRGSKRSSKNTASL